MSAPSPTSCPPSEPAPFDEHALAHRIRTGPLHAATLLTIIASNGTHYEVWPLLYLMSRTADELPWERVKPVLDALQHVGASIDTVENPGRRIVHAMGVIVDPVKLRGWLAMGGQPLARENEDRPVWWTVMRNAQVGVLDELRAHPLGPVMLRMRRPQQEYNDVMLHWANDFVTGSVDPQHTPRMVWSASFAWLWQHVPAECGRRVIDPDQPGTRGRLLWVHAMMDQATSVWHDGQTDTFPDHPLNVWDTVIRANMRPDDAPWLAAQVNGWKRERDQDAARYAGSWHEEQKGSTDAVYARAMVSVENLTLARALDSLAVDDPLVPPPPRARL